MHCAAVVLYSGCTKYGHAPDVVALSRFWRTNKEAVRHLASPAVLLPKAQADHYGLAINQVVQLVSSVTDSSNLRGVVVLDWACHSAALYAAE